LAGHFDEYAEALAPPRENASMMKLLIAGLSLIGLGLGLVVFTQHNPALLFIIGVVCAFIAVLHGAMPAAEAHAVPAGSDAHGVLESDR
jgi:1,4-dihydroxy-2-naphthoate octaprenyltransferase